MVRGTSSFDELDPGDVNWAKLICHVAWSTDLFLGSNDPKEKHGQKPYPDQFLGTHVLARMKKTETTSLITGFVSNLHLKCKKPAFIRGLEEAKLYISEKKIIITPQHYLPPSSFYSAGGLIKSTRSFLKKKPVNNFYELGPGDVTWAEVDVKREKRIIRIPQRYLPLSSTSASKSTSRSVPNKKQRLGASGGSDEFVVAANHEEEAAVLVERPNPAVKRWVRLKLQNNHDDYNKIVGLQCKAIKFSFFIKRKF